VAPISSWIEREEIVTTERQAGAPVRTARALQMYLAGTWASSDDVLEVQSCSSREALAGVTYRASEQQYEQAVEAAVRALDETRRLPAFVRGAALRRIAAGITERREELGRLMAEEIGKPIRDSLTEVDRTALTFRLAGEEAERMLGEVIPLDLVESSRGRMGITRRFPVGPIAAISPFNLPLSLAAHKLAPAIAVGAPIVLKPPSRGALSLLVVAEIIDQAGLPAGAVSILPMTRELGDRMVEDERFRLLTFTGSPQVGWDLKRRAGKKKVTLELGGNAGAIVDASADLDRAVERTVYGSFKYAGQLCISVQRLFVHRSLWDEFLDRFEARARALRVGDPLDPASDVGPLIDEAAVRRVRGWIDEAVDRGGKIRFGGGVDGAYLEPTLLTDVPTDATICSAEAFAPIVLAYPFDDLQDALDGVNDSAFGLQAGIFTNDLAGAWKAFVDLEVGGLVVNDVPTYRMDNMPYGGVKDSGLGREGIRYAMDDMTETRIMVIGLPS
jgi:glyceraldehyde-3-phosphate dehydrogenase (NADP+)